MKKRFLALMVTTAIIFSQLFVTALAVVPSPENYVPYNLTATLMETDELHPYGSVDLKFSIDNMPVGDSTSPWAIVIEKKIGNGPWIEVSFENTENYSSLYSLGGGKYHYEQLWIEDTSFTADILVSYRVKICICDSTFSPINVSSWSNVATIGIKSSAWATADILKAEGYGLIPESVKGDYTQPITRQEFAELAVKLYQAKMKTSAQPIEVNPFTDCSNPEVLKAFKLKIVNGVSDTMFKPNDLTNREQIAAMLYRAVVAVAPETDMSVAGAPTFNDEKTIAPYFLDNVKFMSKHEFIKGSNGSFQPKGTCTREMAVVIALRVYEKYAGITN